MQTGLQRKGNGMISPSNIRVLVLAAIVVALSMLAISCSGSKANVRNEASAVNPPAAIEVTTAPAIMRELPRFFEATGSLAGDQQTDVAPSIAGKVVAIGVDLGSYVKRGQMIVHLDDIDSKLRVQQAQAQIDQTKAALRQAEEKAGVQSGQVFDPNKVPEVVNARVALELAEKNLRRAENSLNRATFRAPLTISKRPSGIN